MMLRRCLPLLFLLVLSEPGLRAQTAPPTHPPNEFDAGCKDREWLAVLTKSDPAYPYAIEFARLLSSKGIHVECLCASKMQRFFAGQVGAAWNRTDAGIVEALFLPKGQAFNVELVETSENGRYHYSFRGTPTGAPRMDSSKPMAIIQHGNVLMVVLGDSA